MVFYIVNGLHSRCHLVSLDLGGSCISSPEWLNNKKVCKNPNNNNVDFSSMWWQSHKTMKKLEKIDQEYQRLDPA